MESLLQSLTEQMLQYPWIAPLLAFLAGLISSFTPCALTSVPLIVGYVGGSGERNTTRAFMLSTTFAIGSAITFTILGIIATTAGGLIGASSSWWFLFLGVLMLLMSLQIWGIYEIIPSSYLISKNTKKGYLGALIAGILGGIFSSPCSTPVLIALLALVAGQGSMTWGIVLLLLYSLGHGLLAILCGTSIGFVSKLTQSKRYGNASIIIKWLMGFFIALIGLYMFYLGF